MICRMIVFGIIVWLLTNSLLVLAHEGEDHGESKQQTNVKTNIETRTARVGDFEVLLKNKPLEPDTETSAQLFITNFTTNEPAQNLKATITIESGGNKTEIAAKPAETIGAYIVVIPPMPQGTVKLGAQLESSGNIKTASFGSVNIEHHLSETSNEGSSWARTILSWLGALVILGLLGAGAWFAFNYFRRLQNEQPAEMKKETVSA